MRGREGVARGGGERRKGLERGRGRTREERQELRVKGHRESEDGRKGRGGRELGDEIYGRGK